MSDRDPKSDNFKIPFPDNRDPVYAIPSLLRNIDNLIYQHIAALQKRCDLLEQAVKELQDQRTE